METRKELFDEILKILDRETNLDGKITAKNLKKELLIEVFPDLHYPEIMP